MKWGQAFRWSVTLDRSGLFVQVANVGVEVAVGFPFWWLPRARPLQGANWRGGRAGWGLVAVSAAVLQPQAEAVRVRARRIRERLRGVTTDIALRKLKVGDLVPLPDLPGVARCIEARVEAVRPNGDVDLKVTWKFEGKVEPIDVKLQV